MWNEEKCNLTLPWIVIQPLCRFWAGDISLLLRGRDTSLQQGGEIIGRKCSGSCVRLKRNDFLLRFLQLCINFRAKLRCGISSAANYQRYPRCCGRWWSVPWACGSMFHRRAGSWLALSYWEGSCWSPHPQTNPRTQNMPAHQSSVAVLLPLSWKVQ